MWKAMIGLLMCLLFPCDFTSASSETKASECARELFRGMLVRRGYESDTKLEELLGQTVMVEKQSRPRWSVLPGDVFLALYTFQRPIVEAWIIADSDTCAVVGGDLETILGVRLDLQDQVAHAVHEYNAYVRATESTVALSTPTDLESYAMAVLELVIPSHRYLLVTQSDDVPMRDGVAESEKRRASECLQRVQPVDIQLGSMHGRVSLFSWEEVGGIVASSSVLVFSDAEVAVSREVLCEQLGKYRVRGRL